MKPARSPALFAAVVSAASLPTVCNAAACFTRGKRLLHHLLRAGKLTVTGKLPLHVPATKVLCGIGQELMEWKRFSDKHTGCQSTKRDGWRTWQLNYAG
jgi:hypothetical protein